MTKKLNFIILLILLGQIASGQKDSLKAPSVYKVRKAIEIPVTVGLFVAHSFGFSAINSKPTIDSTELASLDANDIWVVDRWVTRMDVNNREQAYKISDIILYSSVALPVFLALDKQIRKDWLDVLVLYGESHAISTSVYIFTAGVVDRRRPLVYNPEIPTNESMSTGTRLSFYSGHVSSCATSTFFMAKVYSDYHPELGNKKFLLFGAALIPPMVMGYYRMRGMKHFLTDVMVGTLMGASAGILIPHFHKNKKKKNNFSYIPFAGDYSGLKVSYTIR